MPKFAIRIEETLARTLIVEAEDFDKATEIIGDAYYGSGDIILGAEDYVQGEVMATEIYGTKPIPSEDKFHECFYEYIDNNKS